MLFNKLDHNLNFLILLITNNNSNNKYNNFKDNKFLVNINSIKMNNYNNNKFQFKHSKSILHLSKINKQYLELKRILDQNKKVDAS